MILTRKCDSPRTTRNGFTLLELIIVIIILGIVVAMFMPVTRSVGEPARRSSCKNNLKQIGLALHNYHDTFGSFPPPYTTDADGNRLHSWRTVLLPFVDQAALYNKIDFTKAWDDPANAEVFKESPNVFACPSTNIPNGETVYLGIVSPEGFFAPGQTRQLGRIIDKNKIAVIEVDESHAVPWMSPNDVDLNYFLSRKEDTKLQHEGGTHGLMLDGSVVFYSASMPVEERRELMTVREREENTIETEKTTE